jgi:hypothetical protein
MAPALSPQNFPYITHTSTDEPATVAVHGAVRAERRAADGKGQRRSASSGVVAARDLRQESDSGG